MPQDKKKLTIGILAHVDAGKTTLTEAMLFKSGARDKLGRTPVFIGKKENVT